MKKISIITATYNAERCLQSLIDSIIQQKNEFVEFIIIDGKSKDSTISIIKSNQHIIDFWISERDSGIYDAWNKGLLKAKGEWIMFLGADDALKEGAIQNYLSFIDQNDTENVDLISSKIEMIDLKGKSIRFKGWKWEWPRFRYDMTIAHPGALHNRKYFEKFGVFDIKYKIVGDFELLLRAKDKLNTLFMNEVTVIMSEGGVSDSSKAIFEHMNASINSGDSPIILSIVNAIFVLIKINLKSVARKLGLNIYIRKN